MKDNKKKNIENSKNKKIIIFSLLALLVSVIFVCVYLSSNSNKIDKDLKKEILTSESTLFLNDFKIEDVNSHKSIEDTYSKYIDKENIFKIMNIVEEPGSDIEKNSFNILWVFNKNIQLNEGISEADIREYLNVTLEGEDISNDVDVHLHGNSFELLFENMTKNGELLISVDKSLIVSESGMKLNEDIKSNYNLKLKNTLGILSYSISEYIEYGNVLEVYFDNLINISDSNKIQVYINDYLVEDRYSGYDSNFFGTVLGNEYKNSDEIIIIIPKEIIKYSSNNLPLKEDVRLVLKKEK